MRAFSADVGLEPFISADVQLSPFVPPLCVREPLTGVLRPRMFAILLFGREVQRFVPGAATLAWIGLIRMPNGTSWRAP
jgi:ATP-dependent DNA helicase RecG